MRPMAKQTAAILAYHLHALRFLLFAYLQGRAHRRATRANEEAGQQLGRVRLYGARAEEALAAMESIAKPGTP